MHVCPCLGGRLRPNARGRFLQANPGSCVCPRRGSCAVWSQRRSAAPIFDNHLLHVLCCCTGQVPEWLKGTGCKPVAQATVVRIHSCPPLFASSLAGRAGGGFSWFLLASEPKRRQELCWLLLCVVFSESALGGFWSGIG